MRKHERYKSLAYCKYCGTPISIYSGQYRQCSAQCGRNSRSQAWRDKKSKETIKKLIKQSKKKRNMLKENSSPQAYKEAMKMMKQ